MFAEAQFLPRILRDMNDGVLALNQHGEILFLNDMGRGLLGLTEDPAGERYASVFMADESDGKNDAFHQFILDAVYDKANEHTGTISYQRKDEQMRSFRLTSSFLRGSDSGDEDGVVVVFSDVTELERMQRERNDASVVFAVTIVCVSAYLFLWSVLGFFHVNVSTEVMTHVIHVISIIMFIVILKKTSFTVADIGLRIKDPKRTFIPDIAIALGVVALMIGAKLVILQFVPDAFPAGRPFWVWRINVMYMLISVFQEFLARGVMQENLRRIFTGKHSDAVSIVVSALIFGVLHIAHGLMYMIAATLFLGLLGVLYNKQRNIWGLAIIHYVLGASGVALGFLGS